jgi:hypothetical protein
VRTSRTLKRKNLIVDDAAIRALRRRLGAATESEAVRIAVQERLLMEDAIAAMRRIRARGGLEDVFRGSAPDSRKAGA